MSIIFDALKRAEAQAQKGQTPKLASARTAQHARSKFRLWALAALFVASGLSAWWFFASAPKSSDTISSDTIAATGLVKPNLAPQEITPNASDVKTGQNTPPADLAKSEFNQVNVSQADPNQADINSRESAVAQAAGRSRRLTLPSLDTPLTGAAQFAKLPEQAIASAPLVSPPAPVVPVELKAVAPVPAAELSPPKPAETIVPAAPVNAIAAPPAPVATPTVAPEPALPTVFELEYKVRFELPKMAVSMYVYNVQPQFRFVIIGGKRYSEGEQIDSKVSITKIRADGLECDFQGTRFFYPRQSL